MAETNKEKLLMKYTKKLQPLVLKSKDDTEDAHIDADYLLCKLLEELGYDEVTKIYHRVEKWYS